MKKTIFKFGTVNVPDGKRGPWKISTFTLTEEQARYENMRSLMGGSGGMLYLHAGTYRRLTHDKRGIVMSNTPMEIRTNFEALLSAKGCVLINGLGLGMLLEGILRKPEVTHVRVIEIEKAVIALVGPHVRALAKAEGKTLEIINADAYEYRPAKGEVFDYVYHDVWDDVCADNLPKMAMLNRRYGRIADKQGTWSREWIRANERRYG